MKEDNYLSIVIVTQNNQDIIIDRIIEVEFYLKNHFLSYEIVVVDNFSTDRTIYLLNDSNIKMTIVELARRHATEQAFRAGVDICLGDFILEIEDISLRFDLNIIIQMYQASKEGNDFVFLSPIKTNISSKCFYFIINRYFNRKLNSDINTSFLIISSRRGQNKVADTGSKIVNRKISYLLSGLPYKIIQTDIRFSNNRTLFENIDLFVDTAIHYTDLITKFATFVSMLFFSFSLGFAIYALVFYFLKNTTEGWASMIVLMAVGFSGIFLMFAILSKYLFNILNTTKSVKAYTFKSVIKK